MFFFKTGIFFSLFLFFGFFLFRYALLKGAEPFGARIYSLLVLFFLYSFKKKKNPPVGNLCTRMHIWALVSSFFTRLIEEFHIFCFYWVLIKTVECAGPFGRLPARVLFHTCDGLNANDVVAAVVPG